MRALRILVWVVLGGLLVAIGVKCGFIDHFAYLKRRDGGGELYTGFGAAVFGGIFIAAGIGAVYFGFTGSRWNAPDPQVPEIKGWRLWLYRLIKGTSSDRFP